MTFMSETADASAIICILSCLPLLSFSTPVDYAGYSVLEILPTSDADQDWLISLDCQVLNKGFGVQLLCSGSQTTAVIEEARQKNLAVKYLSKHFGEEVKLEKERTKKAKTAAGRHDTYLDIKEIYDWYKDLKAKSEDLVKVDIIGKTLEGRDIKVVKINSENSTLPAIFIDAGIHAREWISPAAVMFFAEKLVKKLLKGKGGGYMDKFQWHIVPVGNPDGYEYSRTTDRMWRKNRRINPGSKCVGVDINRNFPKEFGTASSENPCDEDFRGTEAFSENEAKAIKDYLEILQTQGFKIKAAVSVHSYGNVLIFPWGYTEDPHPEKARLSKLAYKVVNAVRWTTGEIYVPGTAYEVFGRWGVAGGATDDWYMTLGILYSFTWELPERDEDGFHGFLLPAKNIVRVGKQLFVGFNRMTRYIVKEKKLYGPISI